MVWYVSEQEADSVAIKAYLDGLGLSTINAISVTEIGTAKVMIVVEGTV